MTITERVTGCRDPDDDKFLELAVNGRADVIVSGDVVTVTRIDRLARSTFDLFAMVKQIVDAGAQFRSLAEPWADTATSTGPSVPMKLRHRHPGSLDLRARKDDLAHADAPDTDRCRGRRWHERRP